MHSFAEHKMMAKARMHGTTAPIFLDKIIWCRLKWESWLAEIVMWTAYHPNGMQLSACNEHFGLHWQTQYTHDHSVTPRLLNLQQRVGLAKLPTSVLQDVDHIVPSLRCVSGKQAACKTYHT